MGPPRAPPPPRGDVTMPEPPSSWAGSAHPPVKAALIGRAAAGKAGPVGGRTPWWPGLRSRPRTCRPCTGPELPARPRPRRGEPGPAPAPPGPGAAHGGRGAPAPGSDWQPEPPKPRCPGRLSARPGPAPRAPAALLRSCPFRRLPPDLGPPLLRLSGSAGAFGAPGSGTLAPRTGAGPTYSF